MLPGPAEAARKQLRDAGYSHVQTTAALLECDGDGAQALALLLGGWVRPAVGLGTSALRVNVKSVVLAL